MFWVTICITILVGALWYVFFKPETEVIFGFYRLPGKWYWLKRLIFYVLFHLRSAKKKKESNVNDLKEGNFSGKDQVKGYGKGDGYADMERPQSLSRDLFAIDCAYFGGSNKDGCNVAFRIARRHNRCGEIWLFLEVPGMGCFQSPHHPDTDVHYMDGITFAAGGLKFEIVEPMKKWKITYSGKLRKGLCNDILNKPSELVEASFSFTWSAFSQPFNTDTDLACSLLGDGVAREKWSKEFFHRLKNNHLTHYEQWGELRGRLNIEGYEEKQLCLQSLRDHTYGKQDWREFYRYIKHSIYVESGMSLQVGALCQPNLFSCIKFGYLSYANGDIMSMSNVELNLWEIGEKSQEPPHVWMVSFKADGQTYKVKATAGTSPVWYHQEDRGGKVFEVFTKFEVNGMKGWGVSEFSYRNSDGPNLTVPPPCPLVAEPTEVEVQGSAGKITLPFTDPACNSAALVGGKGAQLAQLTSIQKAVNAEVPLGFCLTLKSFDLQLQENKSILKAIKAIMDASISNLADLQSACSSAVELISETDICPEVETSIQQALLKHIGSKTEKIHFAVRSSAAGEDGTEASSAGQMETILGVVGFSQIIKAVKRCWASAYTNQAVEYRRQHGQPINMSVAVVIQKMVPADAAGVMFTAHPISASTSSIVINANFGLGESVVSGRTDPDTICVDRDPEFLYDVEALKVSSLRTGEKKTRIVETGDGGIKEEEVHSEGNNQICLQVKMILKLAAVGLELEKRFGSSRDIEWAVVGENIYLLQCRPITVAENDTEEELIHEFDSALTCDYLWLTTANISEMMPGAVTPLTMSIFRPTIEYGLQTMQMFINARRKATHLPKALPAACNHLFLCMVELCTFIMTTVMTNKDTVEINLMGCFLPELTMVDIEKYYGRTKPTLIRRCLNIFNMIREWHKGVRLTEQWEKRAPWYKIGDQATTAEYLYTCIDNQLQDYETSWISTMVTSSQSGNASFILMSILAGNQPHTWTSEHYGDIALLLSKCEGVYSAEVPHAIESIAREIANKGSHVEKEFLATSDKKCMKMMDKYPKLKTMINDFLDRHGHRCLRESEFREKSWRSAPEKFISVLKAVLTSKSYEKRERDEVSVSELLDMLKTKLSFWQKLMFKFYLPKAWKAVGSRERGKSLAIQISDIFKLAYSRLATLLHTEGRLPDADLMYFLTHQEIGTLISSRSPRLIIDFDDLYFRSAILSCKWKDTDIGLAQKRRKVLARQAEMKFEQVSCSHPFPINTSSKKAENRNVECLKGMPVSQGEVTGPARVVHRLEDAHVIKSGDILVVNSTDVGWSPYFPLIGGLVTELGGLISHGAVVAREYGIPCVVSIANATSIVKSGEILHLDGRKGTVDRLNVQEKSE